MMSESPPDAALAAALSLHQQGRLTDAIQHYKYLLKKSHPDSKRIYHMLGVALQQNGDTDAAIKTLQKGLMNSPFYQPLLLALGTLHIQRGHPEQAEIVFKNAINKKPTYGEAWYLLGALYLEQHNYAPAIEALHKSVQYLPNDFRAWANLGSACLSNRQYDDAIAASQTALRLDDKIFSVWQNLSAALREQQRFDEALAAFEKVIALHPQPTANLWHEYANLLKKNQRFAEADSCYAKAIALEPDNVLFYRHRAMALEAQQKYDAAALVIQEALITLHAKGIAAPTALISFAVTLAMALCDWKTALPYLEILRERIAAGDSGGVNPLLALPGISAAMIYAMASTYAAQECGDLLHATPLCQRSIDPQRRLKIGYLSGDWRNHATALLLTGALEQHDKTRFEIFGYSIDRTDASDVGKRFIATLDHFRDLVPLADRAAAQCIAADDIDILIDLKGYTNAARPGILALRPAPIQASWLGYPSTLGNRRLADFIIGDPIVTPLEHQADFAETIVQLPHCYQPNDNRRPIGITPRRVDVGLPENAVVLCNFNQHFKLTPDIFAVWCRVLKQIPNAVLWQLDMSALAKRNLIATANEHGVAAERLLFAEKIHPTEHLGRLRLADLAVDTFPYTSHTTASDALWAGVPLVTLLGSTFPARVAASILHNCGLADLIATTLDDYEALILQLAGDTDKLGNCRERLAQNRTTSPLFDTESFTRDLEAVYLKMANSTHSPG